MIKVSRLFGVVLFFWGAQAGAADLVVSAAASLTAALNDIKPVFEASHPGTRLFYNFAASGILARQIEGGAPVDVFISAAPQPMDQLQAHGRILDGTRIGLLSNELVLVVPQGAQGRIKGFEDLSGAARIALGDPGFVPAGQYAQQILRYLGLWESLRPRLIYGQDVRQVLEYVARAEVDAGIVLPRMQRCCRTRSRAWPAPRWAPINRCSIRQRSWRKAKIRNRPGHSSIS